MLEHLAAQLRRDLDRGARHARQAADVEERLVDRQPLDERRGVLEHLEHGLARLDVRGEARRDHDRPRAQPPRLPAAHRGADPERLGLVARGEHDPAADDHRPAPQPRVVALLHRRVEGVEVGVEDRRCRLGSGWDTNICSHPRRRMRAHTAAPRARIPRRIPRDGGARLPPCATDGCRSRSSRPSSSATTPSPTTCPRARSPTGASPTSGSTSAAALGASRGSTTCCSAYGDHLGDPLLREAVAAGGAGLRADDVARHAGRGRGAVRDRDVAARAGRPRGRRAHQLRDEPRDSARDRRRRSTSSTSRFDDGWRLDVDRVAARVQPGTSRA